MLYTRAASVKIEPPAQSEAILEKSIDTRFAQVCGDGVGNKVRDVILAGSNRAVDLTNCFKCCTKKNICSIQTIAFKYTIKVQ